MSLLSAYFLESYKSQIRVEGGKTYYTGSVYPDRDFFDAHWTYGGGSTLVIPSSLVWDQVATIAPSISRLESVKKILSSEADQYSVGSVYEVTDIMTIDYYKEYYGLVASRIPYSLGNSGSIAHMSFTKVSEHVIQGSVTYELKSEEFDWERNGAERNWYSIKGNLKSIGGSLAGDGTKFMIDYSGNTALRIEGTVADVGASMSADGKFYPIENSERSIILNYDSAPAPVIVSDQRVIEIAVATPPDASTRDSSIYIADTGANDHFVTFKDGGTVWDAFVLQSNRTGGFSNWDEFQEAVKTSNPQIDNLNQVAKGSELYLPEKLPDGSITYHYTGGASINNNATTGEYHMVVPNAEGGQTIYSRTVDGDAGYVVVPDLFIFKPRPRSRS